MWNKAVSEEVLSEIRALQNGTGTDPNRLAQLTQKDIEERVRRYTGADAYAADKLTGKVFDEIYNHIGRLKDPAQFYNWADGMIEGNAQQMGMRIAGKEEVRADKTGKKHGALIGIIAAVCTAMVGCGVFLFACGGGSFNKDSGETQEARTQQTEPATQETTDTEEEAEEVEETVEMMTLEMIGEEGYVSISKISDNLFMVGIEGEELDDEGNPKTVYGVIDAQGNEVIPCRFTGWLAGMQDDCFTMGVWQDGNLLESYLFDKDGNEIWENTYTDRNMYIASYNEDVLQLQTDTNTGVAYEALFLRWKNGAFEEMFQIPWGDGWFADDLRGASPWKDGRTYLLYDVSFTNNQGIMTGMVNYVEETEEGTYSTGTLGGSELGLTTEDGEEVRGLIVINYASTAEGWLTVLPVLVNEETQERTWGSSMTGWYAYHPERNELVYTGGHYGFYGVTGADGLYRRISDTGYMGLCTTDAEPHAHRIFNVNTGEDLTEEGYGSVSLEDFDHETYILVSDVAEEGEENRWTFIDQDGKEIGTWYDDASNFRNGYALVVTDGVAHIINEELEICSEDIEGEGVQAYGEGYVGIVRDGKLYLAKIVPAE